MLNRQAGCQARRINRLRGFIIPVILIAVITIGSPLQPLYAATRSMVLGQLPSLTLPNGTQPLPPGVERRGTLESARVRLDGQELFRIASPAVLDRSNLSQQIPVEVRATQIEANLEQLLPNSRSSGAIALNPETLEVVVQTINGQPVLFVEDDALAEARVLLTVTDADAQYHAISPAQLAEQWQEILERELRQSIELRQPEALRRQATHVGAVMAASLLLTFLLNGVSRSLKHRQRKLVQQCSAASELAHREQSSWTGPFGEDAETLFQGLHSYFNLERRLQIVRFLEWLLFWAIVLLWVAGLAYSFNAFPQTRHLARKLIAAPIILLIAWFFTGLTNRLVDLAIDRFIQTREQEQSLTPANLQRIATIARVIKGLKMVVVYAVVILWILQWFYIVPGSILTLGAVFTLVISFAAQNLVRDLVNGFLILLEDQFRIGDNIRVGSVNGMVENLNLRITQIRTDDGNLVTLPNSMITDVENRSRTWARADFRVEVAYHTDIDQALAIVRETVDQMEQDPEWRSVILDTHELFGVDQISHTGIVIRIWLKTMPLQQWRTARELRRRLKIAFDRHHIQIGVPQQVMIGSEFYQNN